MDRSAAWQRIRSRRGLVVVVCLAMVFGGGADEDSVYVAQVFCS